MRDETNDINWHLNDPRTRKWIVQCSVCNTSGFRHDAPEKFFGKAHLEKNFRPMQLIELCACEDCGRFAVCPDETSDGRSSNVAIIVGAVPRFDLRKIARSMEVWAPNLPEHKQTAERIREALPESSITLFDAAAFESPEQKFPSWLPAVDLHHGEYSSETPWAVMHVYGASITVEITRALKEYGVEEITPTEDGFRACRSNSTGATESS